MRVFTAAGVFFGMVLAGSFLSAEDRDLPGDLLKASTIIGKEVVNLQGESLGKVENFVVDPETGRIDYAVLSYGGFLGLGDKYFAVPWKALRQGPKEKFVLDVDKAKLKNAPGFDKDHWPDLSNNQTAATIYEFYGLEPGEVMVVRFYTPDFGTDQGAQRQALDLPLKFQEGKTYHYLVEGRPYSRGSFSSPSGRDDRSAREERRADRNQADPNRENPANDRNRPATDRDRSDERTRQITAAGGFRKDLWLKAVKAPGDWTELEVTFGPVEGNVPECCREANVPTGKQTFIARVDRNGKVLAFEPQGGAADQKGTWQDHMRTHLEALVGTGLHGRQLEPGRLHDVSWLSHKQEAVRTESERTATGERDREVSQFGPLGLRFDGTTDVDGARVALFTFVMTRGIVPENKRAGERTGQNGQPGQPGEPSQSQQAQAQVAKAAAQGRDYLPRETELGRAVYSLDDGLLQRAAMAFRGHRGATVDRTTAAGTTREQEVGGDWQMSVRRVE